MYVQVENKQNILKLRCWPIAFTSCKVFLENKKWSGISLFATFSTWFLKKNISYGLFYLLTKFYYLIAFTLRYLAICLLQLFVSQFVTSQISKITLALSSSRSATHSWNGLPTHSWNSLYKDGGVEFSKFSKKFGGSSDISHKKGEVGKIGGELEKEGSIAYFHTN